MLASVVSPPLQQGESLNRAKAPSWMLCWCRLNVGALASVRQTTGLLVRQWMCNSRVHSGLLGAANRRKELPRAHSQNTPYNATHHTDAGFDGVQASQGLHLLQAEAIDRLTLHCSASSALVYAPCVSATASSLTDAPVCNATVLLNRVSAKAVNKAIKMPITGCSVIGVESGEGCRRACPMAWRKIPLGRRCTVAHVVCWCSA
jgi:hypothetical protein